MTNNRDADLRDLITRVLEAHISCPSAELIRDLVDIAKSERRRAASPVPAGADREEPK